MKQYWMVKQEPEEFSWIDLEREGKVIWDGVRNYQARNNLKAMNEGDEVLFYHSVTDKCVVGLTMVSRTAFPDPSDESGKWVSVELVPVRKLSNQVTLEQIKNESALAEVALIRQSRLSVMPLTEEQFCKILTMGEITPA